MLKINPVYFNEVFQRILFVFFSKVNVICRYDKTLDQSFANEHIAVTVSPSLFSRNISVNISVNISYRSFKCCHHCNRWFTCYVTAAMLVKFEKGFFLLTIQLSTNMAIFFIWHHVNDTMVILVCIDNKLTIIILKYGVTSRVWSCLGKFFKKMCSDKKNLKIWYDLALNGKIFEPINFSPFFSIGCTHFQKILMKKSQLKEHFCI